MHITINNEHKLNSHMQMRHKSSTYSI